MILFGISKAFGAINRDIMRTIMYETGIPSIQIKIIRVVRGDACLRPKNKGGIGGEAGAIKEYFK